MTCLIPFDLYRLDGNLRSDGNHGGEPTMDRILAIAKVRKVFKIRILYLFSVLFARMGKALAALK